MPLIPKIRKHTIALNLHRFFRFTCNGKYSEKDINRFISKIDTTPGLGPNGKCWEWMGNLSENYGGFGICKNGKSKNYRTHRVAIEMATNKIIPDGMVVMHKCDNPKCVNIIDCLKINTIQNNIQDMYSKKRNNQANGENHCRAKLTWIQVREIRRLYATGEYTQRQLANIFNINKTNIGCIIDNTHWYDPNYIKTISKMSNCKLNIKDIA